MLHNLDRMLMIRQYEKKHPTGRPSEGTSVGDTTDPQKCRFVFSHGDVSCLMYYSKKSRYVTM